MRPRHLGRAAGLALALALLLLGGGRDANAGGDASASASASESVIVILESDHAKPPEVETIDAIRAQVGDLPVRVVVERHAPFSDLRAQMDWATSLAASRHARGVFWVDTDAAGDALLFMLDPDGSRLLLRRIKREGAGEAVTEDVANVARTVVEALSEGRRIGMTAVALEPATPHAPHAPRHPHAPHAPRAHAPRPKRLAAEVGWAGETWGAGVPWIQGTAIGAELALPARGWLVRAQYTFFLPASVGDAGTTIHLTRHPFDLSAGWDARVGPISLGAELGITVDPVLRTTAAVAPGLTPAPDSLAWTVALSPRARLRWHLARWVGVYLHVGADVFVTQANYAVGDAALLTPDPVRLRVDSGLTFTVF